MNQEKIDEFVRLYGDPWLRLNRLYQIVDKRGKKITFTCNWAQEELYRNMWYCNVVLKARQLGISTFICLLFLDRCLFNDNVAAGIICHTREDAEHMFKRIKLAYDSLPDWLRSKIPATVDSARELVFNNGSSIRVGTSMRGSTLQYLHISEFGKICAKYVDKAQEVITGSLNTLAEGQYCFIESTAEGREGYFYDICQTAQNAQKLGKDLSKLEFKFHFFPWHKEPSYRIGNQIVMQEESLDYFESLKARGIDLDYEQKCWYAARHATQAEEMMREYPSTPEEAWETTNEGLYYGRQIGMARVEKRITSVYYDETVPVHTAWDLGYNDSTAIWFVQLVGKEIHLIDYIEGSGESLAHWLGKVKERGYSYGMHIAPHDIMAHEYTSGMTRQASARKMGINFVPSAKVGIIQGIDQVRAILNRCWFDEKKCASGIKALDTYKKEWDDKHGCWKSQPLHNAASHGSDAFRSLATGMHLITGNRDVDGRSIGGQSVTTHLRNMGFR